MEIANCHGRISNSEIIKLNLYNTTTDKLQRERDNTPFKFANIGQKISAIAKIGTKRGLTDFDLCKEQFDKRVRELKANISNLLHSSISTRAEFRISLRRFNAITSIILSEFSGRGLNEKVVLIKSRSLRNLSLINIEMLSAPINSCICLAKVHFENGNYESFEQAIVTLSAFESLLSSTLFSGRTYSYASDLIWKKPRSDDIQSTQLLKAFNKFNRIVIPERFWVSDELILRSFQFEDLIEKISGLKRVSMENQFKLVRVFMNPESSKNDEAKAIWMSYFSILTDVDFSGSGNRWKADALTSNRRIVYGISYLESVIESIFNIERLNSTDSAWNDKVFLLAFRSWVDYSRSSGLQLRIKSHYEYLRLAAEEMRIEIVHYFSDDSKQFYAEKGLYLRLETREEEIRNSSNVEVIVNQVVIEAENSNNGRFGRKAREEFSQEEVVNLVDALNLYWDKTNIWKNMNSDPKFCFFHAKNRTNDVLRKKFKSLESNGTIYFDNTLKKHILLPELIQNLPKTIPIQRTISPLSVTARVPATPSANGNLSSAIRFHNYLPSPQSSPIRISKISRSQIVDIQNSAAPRSPSRFNPNLPSKRIAIDLYSESEVLNISEESADDVLGHVEGIDVPRKEIQSRLAENSTIFLPENAILNLPDDTSAIQMPSIYSTGKNNFKLVSANVFYRKFSSSNYGI